MTQQMRGACWHAASSLMEWAVAGAKFTWRQLRPHFTTLERDRRLIRQRQGKMAVLLGLYALGIISLAISVILLACSTYQPLRQYVHKWREMQPIPGMAGAYPIIGNALQFKTNAGGKQLGRSSISLLLAAERSASQKWDLNILKVLKEIWKPEKYPHG